MGYFVCLMRLSGAPVMERDRDRVTALARKKALLTQGWATDGCFAATAVGTQLRSSPSVVTLGSLTVVGTARLDNREELASCANVLRSAPDASDLEIVGATLRERGSQALAAVIGDFAFACWDSKTRTVLAARDSLGVQPLFWALIGPDLLALGSHASLLALDDRYSHEYIAHLLAGAQRSGLTIFQGVQHVPAGASMGIDDGQVIINRYWSPEDVPVGDTRFRVEQCDEFRELFLNAVRYRLPADGCVWSELSGGLDTSAIIMTSDHLYRSGAVRTKIAGTLLYSGSLDAGGESQFVDAILAASGLPNVELKGFWPWQDDGTSPRETELPTMATTIWARDRRRDELLREAGVDVLLSGVGGDYVLGGNGFYFADWVARGRVLTACRELIRLSALGRESFWQSALANAVVPLLPTMLRSRFATEDDWVVPSWVNAEFRRRYCINGLARSQRAHGLKSRTGSKYREAFENRVKSLAFAAHAAAPSVDYERRYPFLYRPLVEFALRLPPNDGGHRPLVRKWILREAMRGVLPETVRTRVSKGSAGSRMVWALDHERNAIESMLQDPVLAQMGCIDAAPLREAYAEARTGRIPLSIGLFTTLALETWLRIRSGRWPGRSTAVDSSSNSSTVNLQEVL